jgi:benzoyl-CoA reductase/2-hydroxyglutaryl-CoA dehydratase subunit BcrC/BadD/HgdB
MSEATGMAKAKEVYANRGMRARELREQGKKVAGYFCCYPPVEMMTALDMVPFRIFGDANESIEKSDTYMEDIACPFVRSSFDLLLKGKMEFLDLFVDVHSCDNCEKIYDIWRTTYKFPHTHFIEVPHSFHDSSRRFFKFELQRFQGCLEEIAGRAISRDELIGAIKLHNEQRSLLRSLYEFKKNDPPAISAAETVQVLVAVMSLPVQEGNELLRQVINEVKKRPMERPAVKRPRFLVWGGPVNNIELMELLEQCGVDVAIDDLCTGTKFFLEDVPMTGGDPLDGLTWRYFDGITCPRTFYDRDGSYKEQAEKRFGYIKKLAREFKADAAFLGVITYCDIMEYEAPEVRDYLEELGLPALQIEYDYSVRAFGALKTRIEAFVEVLRTGSAGKQR